MAGRHGKLTGHERIRGDGVSELASEPSTLRQAKAIAGAPATVMA